jgi:hypothetical protein
VRRAKLWGLALWATLIGVGATGAQDSLEDKLQKKLKEPFLGKAPWITDYEKGKEESRKSGKPIFAYFTRSFLPSDECGKVEGGAFQKPEFVTFAQKFVLYCNVTSQVPGAKDQALVGEKGWSGSYPYLAFLDSDGALIAKHEGDWTVERFQEEGGRALGFFELRAKAEKGGGPEKIDYILAQLELGLLKPGDAEVKIRETGGRLSDAQEKKMEGLEANWEIETTLRALKRNDAKGRNDAAKKFYERYKAGKAAPLADMWMTAYWNLIMEYAQSIQDVPAFETSFTLLKAKHGNLPEAKQYFEEKEAWLKKMKEKK